MTTVHVYDDRAAAEAATVPTDVDRICVLGPNDESLGYIRDSSGTALTTQGSVNWSPISPAYPDHFKENTNPGTTDMSSAVQAWLDWGGGTAYDAVYACNDIEIDTKVFVTLSKTTRFRKNDGSDSESNIIRFVAGAENSVWRGGTIDGNRSVLQSDYDTLHPTNPGYLSGWLDLRIECLNVSFIGARVLNSVAYPVVCTGDRANLDVYCNNHGAAAFAGFKLFSATGKVPRPSGNGGRNQTVRIVSEKYDNAGSVLTTHAVDVRGALDGEYDLAVRDPDGDTSSASDWLSGVTMEDNEGTTFKAIAKHFKGDDLKHVGIAFHGNIRCVLRDPEVFDVCGTLFEANDNSECQVWNPMIDADYRSTNVESAEDSQAMSLFRGTWNDTRSAKPFAGNNGFVMHGGFARRCGEGPIIRDDNSQWIGGKSYGHLSNGIVLWDEWYDDYFPGAEENKVGTTRSIIDCEVFGNGARGISQSVFRDSQQTAAETKRTTRFKVQGCMVFNNGQDSSLASHQRDGIATLFCDHGDILGNQVFDNQNWSITNGASFVPMSAQKHEIYVKSYDKIHIGQWLTLANGDGSGDVTGRVVDIGIDDNLTLDFGVSVTLSSTGNTKALSGTWSGSGTVLTGVSGDLVAEVTGQTYVSDGIEWRRVVKVSSANELTLIEPFTATLSGASLSALAVDVSGNPSQSNGIRKAVNASDVLLISNAVFGNTEADYSIESSTNVDGKFGIRPGSEYFETYVETISTDPIELAEDIPANHFPVGISCRVDQDISPGTSWGVRLLDSGGNNIKNLAANVGLSKNDKTYGSRGDFTTVGAGNMKLELFVAGGVATTGGATVRVDYRVAAAYELPDLP